MAVFVLVVALFVATPAFAQMQSRATDAPVVNAAGEAWYQLREPLEIGGDLYYHAGAAVFFNGNAMVRTGHYNGVPLYVDATVDSNNVVLLPIGQGRMQPYERARRGGLSGSAGNRLSAFPIRLLGDAAAPRPGMTGTSGMSAMTGMTAVAPTQLPYSMGAIATFTPEPMAFPAIAPPPLVYAPIAAPAIAAPAALVSAPPFLAKIIISPTRAENNDGVWLQFDNQRWVVGGRAQVRTPDLQQVGTIAGFPVLRRTGEGDVIYLPTGEGLVAPYRRKG
ncbi:MAG TPA: hypothetical protein VIY56_02945 [Vicinamibacterales bacterium]